MGENAEHRSAFKWLQNEPARRVSFRHDAGEVNDCDGAGKRSRLFILSCGWRNLLLPFDGDP